MKKPIYITEPDIISLVDMFTHWCHPAVRDQEKAAILSNGDVDSARKVFDLLLWVLLDAPDPTGAQLDFKRLGDRLLGALSGILHASHSDVRLLEEQTEQLILALEPFCRKIIALLEPAQFEKIKSTKKGLAYLITALQNIKRIPYNLNLSSSEFEQTEGWDTRNSYENAVRDIIPARLDKAHRATAPSHTVWRSAVAFILGIIDHNKEDLFAIFISARSIFTNLSHHEQAPHGIPLHRRIANGSPEPLTTRQPIANEWRCVIEDAAGKHGRVLILVGPPGWGKSMFLSMALDGISRPMHFVDLTDSFTDHDLAESLLAGLHVSSDERQTVDQRPMSSVRLLSDWLGSSGIVVFENLHRSIHANPPHSLGRCIRLLHEFGHFIIIEAWTRQLDCISQIPQGQLKLCTQQDIPRLEQDEIAAWGTNVLNRQLETTELLSLELFDGYPMITRRALEMLDMPLLEIGTDADSQLLELCLDWERLHQDVAAFINHQPAATRNEPIINNEIAAWCAMLPWACPFLEELPTASQHTVRRLLFVGFITLDGQSCRTEAWARILGLQRITETPNLISDYWQWLEQLAASVPVVCLEQQRRHLACLAAKLPSARELILNLLNLLPTPISSELNALSDMPTAYDAPPDVATITSALEFSSIQSTCDPSVAAGATNTPEKSVSMPPDVQFWFLESAGRLNDYNLVAGQLHTLSHGGYPLVLKELRYSWMAIKAVHQTIMQLTISNHNKFSLYKMLCSLLPEDVTPCTVGYRAWVVRLLSAASKCAFAAGNPSTAIKWLDKAESIHRLIQRPQSDLFSKALHDDTAYRIVASRAEVASNLHELLTAHRNSLDAIPPKEEWFPNNAAMWTRRELNHLRVLFHSDQHNHAFRHRLMSTLRQLPVNRSWLNEMYHLLWSQTEETPFIAELRKFAHHRVEEIDITIPNGIALQRLGRLIAEPDRWRNHTLDWSKEIINRLEEARYEDFELLSQTVTIMSRKAFVGKSSDIVYQIAEKVIDVLPPLLPQYRENILIQRLYAQCLSILAKKHLLNANIGQREMNPSTELMLIKAATRRIDRLYSALIVDGASPWIWEEWAEYKIECTRRRYALERKKAHPELDGISPTSDLEEFCQRCELALGDHIVSHAVAVRISRYLWDWDTVRTHLQSIAAASANFTNRLRIVMIVVDALSTVAISPQLLKVNNEVLTEHEFDLLEHALDEQIMFCYSGSIRVWSALIRQALRRETDVGFWEQIVKQGQEIFGNPEGYWHQITTQIASENDPTARQVVSHLTDLQGLLLAGRLFRFGAGNENIPLSIRHSLAELAVAASVDADAWYRSSSGRRDMLAPWHVGISIGLGLAASPEGKLFGTIESMAVTRHGRKLTWAELMDKELNIVQTSAVGSYRKHSREVWNQLRILAGGIPLRQL